MDAPDGRRRGSWRERRAKLKERDERWLLRRSIKRLDRALTVLFLVFVALNFVDVVSTLTAISGLAAFRELNPVASFFFRRGFSGFLGALVVKYGPFAPMTYGVFVREREENRVWVRTVKISILAVLLIADAIYIGVAVNNLTNLWVYLR